MQYNPKLKVAMEEFRALFERYDIGGFVCLHLPGHSEYAINLHPSYSCAHFKENGETVEIKGTNEYFGGDLELKLKVLNDTVNMFTHMQQVAGMMDLNFGNILDRIKTEFCVDIEKDDSEHTSHKQQNQ